MSPNSRRHTPYKFVTSKYRPTGTRSELAIGSLYRWPHRCWPQVSHVEYATDGDGADSNVRTDEDRPMLLL